MNRFTVLLLSLIFAGTLAFMGCGAGGDAAQQSSDTLSPTASAAASEAPDQGAGDAYLAVFDWLWENDTALNSEIKYLSIDLTELPEQDAEALLPLMEAFCEEQELELLTKDFKQLEAEGYLDQLYFPDGVLIAFSEIEKEASRMRVSARKWRSGLGAIGADFEITKQEGIWQISSMENNWIS